MGAENGDHSFQNKFKNRTNSLIIGIISGVVANSLPELLRRYISIAGLSVGLFVLGIGVGLITTYSIFNQESQDIDSRSAEKNQEIKGQLVVAESTNLPAKINRKIISPPSTALVPVPRSTTRDTTAWLRLLGLLVISTSGGTVVYILRSNIYASIAGAIIGIIVGIALLNGATRFINEEIS